MYSHRDGESTQNRPARKENSPHSLAKGQDTVSYYDHNGDLVEMGDGQFRGLRNAGGEAFLSDDEDVDGDDFMVYPGAVEMKSIKEDKTKRRSSHSRYERHDIPRPERSCKCDAIDCRVNRVERLEREKERVDRELAELRSEGERTYTAVNERQRSHRKEYDSFRQDKDSGYAKECCRQCADGH